MFEERAIKMFDDYEDLITTGLDYDYSEKEIYNAIYKKEFNLYLRKGIPPRVDELGHIINFVRKFRNGELGYDESFLGKSAKKETEEQKQARITEEKKKRAKEERLKLYKLDPDNNTEDRKMYKEIRFAWFFEEEGDGSKKEGINKLTGQKYTSGNVYEDSKKRPTVGIGFDMKQDRAINEWNLAFLDENNRPDFDEVSSGKRNLTKQEMIVLFNHSVSSREERLKTYIGQENWQKLKPNERLALESANYNGVVGPELKKRIRKYTETGKKEDLDAAFRELASNESVGKPYLDKELQPRREGEAELLASHHDKENYIEPALTKQMEVSSKKIQFSVGQQIPSNLRTNQSYKSGEYFI